MKIQPDVFEGGFTGKAVTAYGPGWIAINGEKVQVSTVISAKGVRFDWDCASFAAMGPAHFEKLAALKPELVIFGSGASLKFPRPDWLASLYSLRIGVETMDTAAACRTYNILAGEGRDVVLAALIENPSNAGDKQSTA